MPSDKELEEAGRASLTEFHDVDSEDYIEVGRASHDYWRPKILAERDRQWAEAIKQELAKRGGWGPIFVNVLIQNSQDRLARLTAQPDPAITAVRDFLHLGDNAAKILLAAVDAARANQKAGAK